MQARDNLEDIVIDVECANHAVETLSFIESSYAPGTPIHIVIRLKRRGAIYLTTFDRAPLDKSAEESGSERPLQLSDGDLEALRN